MSEMYTVTENITPELARFYLQNNRSNRPVSERAVDALAWDMHTGRFVTTEQGIAFDENMNLVDGQHRLHAIVKSGCAQTMRVTMNAPGIEAPRDRGRIRAIGDFLLDSDGARIEQSRRVAAVCSALQLLVTGTDDRPSVDVIRQRYEQNRAGITWVLDAVPPRVPAFLQAPFAYAYPCNPRRVEDFVRGYVELANLSPGSPVIALNRAVSELTHRRVSERFDTMLRALRCIQLYVLGRQIQRITNLEDGYEYFRTLHMALQATEKAS